MRTFGKIIGWGRVLSLLLFFSLYHLSSLKNHFVAEFLVWIGSFCSFSFEFRCSLED